jgi:hypothetical protein
MSIYTTSYFAFFHFRFSALERGLLSITLNLISDGENYFYAFFNSCQLIQVGKKGIKQELGVLSPPSAWV